MIDNILGYDVRCRDDGIIRHLWDKKRRAHYLIRQDIKCPISVDRSVLPSIFRFQSDGILEGTIPVEDESMHQSVFKLWEDFSSMSKAISDSTFCEDTAIDVVALGFSIGEIDVSQFRNYQWAEILSETAKPNKRRDDWEFLGYDIADEWLTSGLSNCDFPDRHDREFVADWIPRINDSGLIATMEDADRFRKSLNNKVAEHAPFLIIGIFRLELPLL